MGMVTCLPCLFWLLGHSLINELDCYLSFLRAIEPLLCSLSRWVIHVPLRSKVRGCGQEIGLGVNVTACRQGESIAEQSLTE